MQKVFFGPHDEHVTVQNPVISKLSVLTIMALLIVFFGLYPKPLIKLANYPLKQLLTPEEVQKSARTVGETKVKLTFITNHSDSDETLYKKD
jgi:NADH:ubiquinone oxidoreductase subunit 4 (subunit M)